MHHKDLKKKIDKCKTVEGDLKRRVKYAKDDAHESKNAARRIREAKETKKLVATAAEASIKDANITKGLRKEQRGLRKGTETRRDMQEKRLKGTKLKWRN